MSCLLIRMLRPRLLVHPRSIRQMPQPRVRFCDRIVIVYFMQDRIYCTQGERVSANGEQEACEPVFRTIDLNLGRAIASANAPRSYNQRASPVSSPSVLSPSVGRPTTGPLVTENASCSGLRATYADLAHFNALLAGRSVCVRVIRSSSWVGPRVGREPPGPPTC